MSPTWFKYNQLFPGGGNLAAVNGMNMNTINGLNTLSNMAAYSNGVNNLNNIAVNAYQAGMNSMNGLAAFNALNGVGMVNGSGGWKRQWFAKHQRAGPKCLPDAIIRDGACHGSKWTRQYWKQ